MNHRVSRTVCGLSVILFSLVAGLGAGAEEIKGRGAAIPTTEWMSRIDALNFSATATAAERRERDKLLAAIVGVPDPAQREALSEHFAQRATQAVGSHADPGP